jgi:hypothetical protein
MYIFLIDFGSAISFVKLVFKIFNPVFLVIHTSISYIFHIFSHLKFVFLQEPLFLLDSNKLSEI